MTREKGGILSREDMCRDVNFESHHKLRKQRVFNVVRVWIALGRIVADETTEINCDLIVTCLSTFCKCGFYTRSQEVPYS